MDAEGLAASFLSNPSDPSMLTNKEIKDGWGSFTNFMLSYGLKPFNHEHCEEAVAISKALAEGRQFDEEQKAKDTK